ncbi:acyltransferase [Micromonospora sp. NBC_01699]|uniref:acyltransferase n=1 Tax=Micromonospora sp. NBC_01699 TaxID=2975984 RepID=UPI002E2AF348|nr:acyltransferase [Micromonospora sp. NBC_01699]
MDEPTRDHYLDLLRTMGLARVFLYHASGWTWLSVLFPAMGVMFGIGGSLMAASLDRNGATAVPRRIRRLLLPFWAFGALSIAVLFLTGWRTAPTGRLGWTELGWWIVPVQVPPVGGQPWSWAFNAGLWYVVTYVWFVLASGVLLKLFRRRPWWCLGIATYLPAVFLIDGVHTGYFLVGYLPCWLLGFAHRDGLLHRIPARRYGALVAALAVSGGGWLLVAAVADDTSAVNQTPVGRTLWSMALVAAVLRLRPRLGRLARTSTYRRVVGLANARAVTIYLWHIPAGMLVTVLLLPVVPVDAGVHLVLRMAGMCAVTAVAVAALGWVEDVAAARRPTLLAGQRTPRPPTRDPAAFSA